MNNTNNTIDESGEKLASNNDENWYYDLYATIGMPLWLDEDTLNFLFSVRYNSTAFNGSYLQEDYRERIHAEYSDVIKNIIKSKMSAIEAGLIKTSNFDDRILTINVDSLRNNRVVLCAKSLGIDVSKIDVAALVFDVIDSLEKIMTPLIDRHPRFNKEDSELAKNFMYNQLWDSESQLEWRNVSASTLAKMYSYWDLEESLVIIRELNEKVKYEFKEGCLQDQSIETADFSFLLSDDVILDIQDNIHNNDEFKDKPLKWSLPIIISNVVSGDDDDEY